MHAQTHKDKSIPALKDVDAEVPIKENYAARLPRAGNKTYDVVMKCAQEGFDPVRHLIDLFQSEDTDIPNKIDICKTLLSYMAPKVRSIQFNGKFEITHESIMKALVEPPKGNLIEG